MSLSSLSASLHLDVTLNEIEVAESKETKQGQYSFDELANSLENSDR